MSDLSNPLSSTKRMLILFTASLLLFSATGITAQSRKTKANTAQKLEINKDIERTLNGGLADTYEINLKAGQYLKVIVDQRGIDVVVTLINPLGVKALEVDSPNGANGEEPLAFITATAGKYHIEVRSLEKNAPAGRYSISLVELRVATATDRALMEADKLMKEAIALRDKGAYNDAAPLALQALTLRERALGKEHISVSDALNDLTILYIEEGEFAKAETVAQRALAIREKNLGADAPAVGEAVDMLGMVYKEKGDYDKAEPLFHRAFTIYEKRFGSDHPSLAPSLNNLGELQRARGDYVGAEQFFQRALEIREKAFGKEGADVARSLNNLAEVYFAKGDYTKAEQMLMRALAINRKAYGEVHPETATSLNNLATVYYYKKETAKALPLLEQALAIKEKLSSKDSPDLAGYLENMASLYAEIGNHDKAEKTYLRALGINEKLLGANHPDIARTLGAMATLYTNSGEYDKAETDYLRALAIYEKAFGAEHPDVAFHLINLATLYVKKGDIAKAINAFARGNDVREAVFVRNLVAGSEREKLIFIKNSATETNATISCNANFAPNDREATRAALKVLLQRKGRALDAMTDTIATLRRRASGDDQKLLDQLQEARANLASTLLKGMGNQSPAQYKAQTTKLQEQIDKLEAQVSRRSAEFRVLSQPVTIEAIQQAIPQDAVLVEFTGYRPVSRATGAGGELGSKGVGEKARSRTANSAKDNLGSPHYAAYVLGREGDPLFIELGEAKPIDAAIAALRKALRDKTSPNVKQLARDVDARVMQPIRKVIGEEGKRGRGEEEQRRGNPQSVSPLPPVASSPLHLFLSPDGALNLIPFAALVDEQGDYLVKNYEFTYLTSGRDLLRLQSRIASKQAALVMADADFDGKAVASASNSTGDMRAGTTATNTPTGPKLGDIEFEPLKRLNGSAQEATALKNIMPDAMVLTQDEATETRLKHVSGPAILHIATHGFFLDETLQAGSDAGSTRIAIRRKSDKAGDDALMENPLLRSGLFLAGANNNRSGDDDGVLTALEAAGLDLWGTKLVALSACETGLGEVENGEGVYGLRRALVLAGSETQVISLWAVSDEATRDLMTDYYKRLQAGEGRGEALRQAQLAISASAKRAHPFYWASFIQSGEWANLSGKRQKPDR